MQAIEFITKAKDGIIKIPKKYLTALDAEFRVIILLEPPVIKHKKAQKQLTALKIKTKGLNFDRDEANDR